MCFVVLLLLQPQQQAAEGIHQTPAVLSLSRSPVPFACFFGLQLLVSVALLPRRAGWLRCCLPGQGYVVSET